MKLRFGCLFLLCLTVWDIKGMCLAEDMDIEFAELLEVEDNQGRLGDYGRLIIPEVGVDVALFFSEDNEDDKAQDITDEWDSAVYMPWVDEQSLIADHWTQGFLSIRDCHKGTRAYIKKEDVIEVYVCTELTTGHNLVDYFLIETDQPHVYKMFGEETSPEEETEDGKEKADREKEKPVNINQVDTDYYTKPHEWTGYFVPETEEGQSEYEMETEVFWGQPLEYIEDFDLFMYTCNGRWKDIYIALFALEQEFPRQ